MEQLLIDLVDRNIFGLDRDFLCLDGIFPGKILDPVVQGCAEQHRLALFGLGQHLDEGAQVRIEAHVEHAVRFVDDEEGHLRKVHRAGFLQVDYAPGRADDDIDALFQQFLLAAIADAAVKAGRLERKARTENSGFFFYLNREFAGGNHDERFFSGK